MPRIHRRCGVVLMAVCALAFCPAAVRADSVELTLTNQVSAGKKPSITVVAKEAVSALQLDLERQEDKRGFHTKAGPLKAGARVDLPIGDGKSGRAHWKGKLVVHAASGTSSSEINFESSVGAPGGGLKVGYDRAHLDLEKGRLQFTLTGAGASAALIVIADDGSEIAKTDKALAGLKPGEWIPIDWKPSDKPVLRLELTILTPQGDKVIVKLVPWSVAIQHEEVVFPSGESTIGPSEEKKLDASYKKIVEAVDKARASEPTIDVKVYIAGHTDSVGGSDDNRKLSQARARAIAKWFRDHGLPLPLYFAGFGEDQPRVKTADNVDEARNRRADYVVGVEEPSTGRGRYAVLK